ncbi:MAG: hypothetical protein PHY85_10395 [Bacteroidales bacterium]|nr:hypothetical protein [Bacteroidales bacterium]
MGKLPNLTFRVEKDAIGKSIASLDRQLVGIVEIIPNLEGTS